MIERESAIRLLISGCILALALGGCDKDGDKSGKADDAKADAKADAKTDAKAGDTKDVAAAEPKELVKYCGKEDCPCAPDSINNHHESELLQKCTITKAVEIQGFPIRVDSDVTFNKEGRLTMFYPSEGVTVGKFKTRAKSGVTLRNDGTPKSFYPEEPVEIDGVTCKGGVDLYEGGKLRRCQVGAEVELSGHKAEDGDWVTLDENGKLHRWEVGSRVVTIGKYECTGYLNYVHPTGELMRCGLTDDIKVEGKAYKKDDLVCFGTDGKVAECTTFSFDVGAG